MTWGVLGILGKCLWVIRNRLDVIDKHLLYNYITHRQCREERRKRRGKNGDFRSVSVPAERSGPSASRYSGFPNWQFSQKCYPQRREAVIYMGLKRWLSGQINRYLRAHIHRMHICTIQRLSESLKELLFETEMKADRIYFSRKKRPWCGDTVCVCDGIFTPSSPCCLCIVWTSSSNIQQHVSHPCVSRKDTEMVWFCGLNSFLIAGSSHHKARMIRYVCMREAEGGEKESSIRGAVAPSSGSTPA